MVRTVVSVSRFIDCDDTDEASSGRPMMRLLPVAETQGSQSHLAFHSILIRVHNNNNRNALDHLQLSTCNYDTSSFVASRLTQPF